MKSLTLWRALAYSLLSGVILMTLYLSGCFHSDDDDVINGGVSTRDVSINVSSSGQDIAVTAGETLSLAFPVSFDIKRFGGPFGELTLNLEDHLSDVSVTPAGLVATASVSGAKLVTAAATSDSAQMFLRVAASEAIETVCAFGELYGPFDVMLDSAFQPATVSPGTASATQATIDVVNTGAYSLCVQVLPPIDAIVDLNRLGFTVSDCSEPPADISGTWGGTFSCNDNCDSGSGSVTLTIEHSETDSSIATYTDESGASYQGTVCGNRFSFKGGIASSFEESGTFVLNADGTASKTSTYKETPPGICTGTCLDALVRVGDGAVVTDGTCDVEGLPGHPVRFVLAPDGEAQIELQPCAAFECNLPPDSFSGCVLQVFDIAGTDRFFQFLTPENTGTCFLFDARIQHPDTGVVYDISGDPQRIFGADSIPFATGLFTGSDGSSGTVDFFESVPGQAGFKGFVNPIPFTPCSG